MFRFDVSVFALSIAIFGASSCSGSYCAEPEHEADAMCQLNLGGTVAAFTVTPNRFTLNKDSTTPITISAYSSLLNKLATLTQSGGNAKPFPLGSVPSDGMLKITVRASELLNQGFVPGPAEIEIAGQKRSVRIYVAPKFDGAMFSAAHSTIADHGVGNMSAPVWVGISATGNKKILTIDEYAIATIAKQAIGEYFYDAGNKVVNKFSPLSFSAYNSTPYMDMSARGMALSMTDFVIPEYGNASTSLITQCSLDGTCAGSTAVPYGTIASMASEPTGKLFTGIFNAKVLAFSDPALMTGISFTNSSPSSATPAFLTIHEANGDGHPDIVVWHRDGNVSVAVSDSTGLDLSYDSNRGDLIKTLGIVTNASPDAVAAGDLDQDGLEDLVIVKGSSYYILSNLGGGAFSASQALSIPMQGPAGSAMLTPVTGIAIGDVSADSAGLKDLVLVSRSNRFIAVLENTATVR